MGKYKLSEYEREQRIEFALRCLSLYRHRHQQLAAIRQEFDLSPSGAAGWLKRASTLALEIMNRDRSEWVQDQVNFYLEISRDPVQRMTDRLNAAKRLDKLLGLEAASKVQLGSPILDKESIKDLLANESNSEDSTGS